jgi:hypothetical protein
MLSSLRTSLLASSLLAAIACTGTAYVPEPSPPGQVDPEQTGTCSLPHDDDPSPCGAGGCTSLPPTCPTSCASIGTVRFHLQVPQTAGTSYMASTYSWAGDPGGWFSVTDASGTTFQVVPPTADEGQALNWAPSCSACKPLDIAPLGVETPIGKDGLYGTWTGTHYSLTSTCTQAGNGVVPCGDILCAPAGKYVVKGCAFVSGSNAPPVCTSVPFEFPGTTELTINVGE